MNKKHIITIAGRPGSGKSSTAKGVAARLGYEHFSSGDLFRSLAKELGFDVLQANLTAEQNVEIDHKVDSRLREIGAAEDNKVIDSRTAWHWMPNSFKIFLDLDLQVAADRILNDMDAARIANERIDRDPAEYAKVLKQRLDSEVRRYRGLYNIDPYDTSNYDLVIDTAVTSLEQTVEQIVKRFQDWINH